eukprot:gene4018-14097_t
MSTRMCVARSRGMGLSSGVSKRSVVSRLLVSSRRGQGPVSPLRGVTAAVANSRGDASATSHHDASAASYKQSSATSYQMVASLAEARWQPNASLYTGLGVGVVFGALLVSAVGKLLGGGEAPADLISVTDAPTFTLEGLVSLAKVVKVYDGDTCTVVVPPPRPDNH